MRDERRLCNHKTTGSLERNTLLEGKDPLLRILIWSWSENDEIYNSKHDKEYPVRCCEG
jgi:hypothetical protein